MEHNMEQVAYDEHLHYAVEAAFALEDYDERLEATLADLADAPQTRLDQIIELARCNQQPGLRGTLVEAFLSGDADEIEHAQALARDQAETALVLTAARTILRGRQASSQTRGRRSRMNLKSIIKP